MCMYMYVCIVGICIKKFKRFLKRKVTGCPVEGRLVARSVGSLESTQAREDGGSGQGGGSGPGEKRMGLRNAQPIKQPGQGMG